MTRTKKSELDKLIQQNVLSKRELYIKQDNKKISNKKFEAENTRLEEESKRLTQLKIKEMNKDFLARTNALEEKKTKPVKKTNTGVSRTKVRFKTTPHVTKEKKKTETRRQPSKGIKITSYVTKEKNTWDAKKQQGGSNTCQTTLF